MSSHTERWLTSTYLVQHTHTLNLISTHPIFHCCFDLHWTDTTQYEAGFQLSKSPYLHKEICKKKSKIKNILIIHCFLMSSYTSMDSPLFATQSWAVIILCWLQENLRVRYSSKVTHTYLPIWITTYSSTNAHKRYLRQWAKTYKMEKKQKERPKSKP